VNRVVDRGAIVAGWVGVGMAVTIGTSFLLVIPIEPIYWVLALPAGLMIGYYANARSRREGGPWSRLFANGLLAGVMTGLTLALFLLLIKALFFYADNGYRNEGGPLACTPGADCVYQRYLAAGQGDALEAAGVTDVATFTALYWREQLSTAGLLVVLASTGALAGAGIYGFTNRRGTVAARTSGA
jgi:hypothetical protein